MQPLDDPIDHSRVRQVYAEFPGGILALAADTKHGAVGMVLSSFTNISLDPPLVAISIQTGSRTWRALRTAPCLGLSILAEDQDSVGNRLAAGHPEDRLAHVEYRCCDSGAVLIEHAVSWMECEPHSLHRAGDHTIVVLRVTRSLVHSTKSPLIYHRSNFVGLRTRPVAV